jgi:hypothetical protein
LSHANLDPRRDFGKNPIRNAAFCYETLRKDIHMRKQINWEWKFRLRRQHRLISLFSLIQCWLKGVDGLVFTYSDLARVLPVRKSIREAHINQLAENMREFFPFFVQRYSKRPYKFIACFVSRRPIEDILPKGQNSITKQIEILKQKGVQIEPFRIWKEDQFKDPLEALKAHLVSLARGNIPKIPLMKTTK